MPIVEVTLTEGRTPEQLRKLITALTEAVVDTGVGPRESVRVILREVPATHFAAADVTLAERAEQRTREAAESQAQQQQQKGQ